MRVRYGSMLSIIFTAGGLLLLGCGTDSSPEARGQVIIPRGEGARADSAYSCAGSCGKKAEGGCYCDDACVGWGDCCPDKAQACDAICPADTDLCALTCRGLAVPAGCPTPKCACCPPVATPALDFCPGGVIKPVYDAAGKCVTDYACQSCPTIAGPDPDFCSGGTIEPVYDVPGAACMMIKVSDPASLPCGKTCPAGYQTINGTPTCSCCGICVTGFTCASCPKIAGPAADFCPNGVVVPVHDAAGKCITGYACQGCPKIAGPAADFCPNGQVEPAVDPATGCPTGFKCLPNVSCKGFCGGQAPGNCWCDSSCAAHGDCCSDKTLECK